MDEREFMMAADAELAGIEAALEAASESAAAKGFLVARQFMELRNAAVVWTFALASVFGGILVIALVLA